MDELTKALLATRKGYDDECVEGKFFLDAYGGTGGFRGNVVAPTSSYWGWAADVYTLSSDYVKNFKADDPTSYLDRHDRENEDKFRRRKSVAHYVNHTAPAIDIPLSYIRRKPLTRTNVEGLEDWMTRAGWDDLVMQRVLLLGSVAGSCPVLFDLPRVEKVEGRTALDDAREGVDVQAIPLFPANVLDYQRGRDGALDWIKLRFDYCERETIEAPERKWIEVKTFYRSEIVTYEIEVEGDTPSSAREVARDKNPFGVVPVVTFQPKEPVTGDPILGISLIHEIATENRRHFNLLSELDEHIRSTVFAFLQYPTKDPANAGPVTLGNAAALAIDPQSTIPFAWVAPPPTVAQTLETRIENCEASIYFMARLEFAKGKQISATASGLSRAYEFETTNRNVSDIAGNLARFDEMALRMVARIKAPGTEPRSHAATSYDVEELDKELATLETAARNRFGARLMTELRQKMARKILPNTAPETLEVIDAEITELAVSEANAVRAADAATNLGAPMFPTSTEGEGETEEQESKEEEKPDTDAAT